MGGKCPHRSVKKRRYSHKQFRRNKFLVKGDDAVYDELKKPEEKRNALPVDEDLPGMGQYYLKKRRYPHKQFRRDKFLVKGDYAVYNELNKPEEQRNVLPVDEDLPGMGQQYCMLCDRYFANVTVRDEHFKTKKHRKRVKMMMGPKPHTQLDAELAAGMGMPDNGPKLMSMS